MMVESKRISAFHLYRDLKIPTVKEEISKFSNRFNIRVNNHQNGLVAQLLDTTDQIAD